MAAQFWAAEVADGRFSAPRLAPVQKLGNLTLVGSARLAGAPLAAHSPRAADPSVPSDEGLILSAIGDHGLSVVPRLRGAFSFAIWDSEKRKLTCIRDHLGQRPLYYSETSTGIRFGSWLPELEETGGTVDLTSVLAYLVDHYPFLQERTLRAGVRKVPPGGMLSFDQDREVRVSRYWQAEPQEVIELRDVRDYVELVRETHETCVGDVVRATRGAEIGAHLSGGLDSASVARVADECLQARGDRIATVYSWSPRPNDDGVEDERSRVSECLRLFAAEPVWISLCQTDLDDALRRDLAFLPNKTLVYENRVLQHAARSGIRVILSGWGGDEGISFSGAAQIPRLVRSLRFARVPRHFYGMARRARRSRVRAVVSSVGQTALATAPTATERFTRGRLRRRSELPIDWSRLHPDAPEMRREAQAVLTPRPSAAETQASYLNSGHFALRMETWHSVAAPLGVEHRYPLLDPRLIELALSLPESLWLREGYTRWVFRKAMEPLLPATLVWGQPKRDPTRLGTYMDLARKPSLVNSEPTSEAEFLVLKYRELLAEALSKTRM